MTVTLVWVAVAAAGFAALLMWSTYRSRKTSDLGTVSHQWLAEQRLDRSDSGRR